MIFTLKARRAADGALATFLYDNQTSALTFEDGSPVPVKPFNEVPDCMAPAVPFSKMEPRGKSSAPRTLKIQLGLSCNYACDYCSQRFVPHADETSRKHIAPFLDSLSQWMTAAPTRIEFWGGEPLVYIKTLVPLAEALRERFPDAMFSTITNGSLLTPDLNEWFDRMGFHIAISHDGPGQHVRGPDPLDVPAQRAAILDLYQRLAPGHRISFNAMIHRENLDREALQAFFIALTGDENVPIGEGAVIDAYDEAGRSNGLNTLQEQVYLRRKTIDQLQRGTIQNFAVVWSRVTDWMDSIAHGRPAAVLGTKCGMEHPSTIVVDLKGNVVTCQNVSAESIAPNGVSHKLGHVSDIGGVSLATSTHWSRRPHCGGCPVVQACKGNCMFLEGENFWRSCDNSYSDNVPFFAFAIEVMTDFLPYRIEGGNIPEGRRDIWGNALGEVNLPIRRRVIAIKAEK
ncbi:radical SAM protein [Achromobacter sp. AGC39]